MRFRLSLAIFMVLLSSIVSRSHAKCRCPKADAGFVQKFKAAHTVVRAYVLEQWTSCHLCPHEAKRKQAVRVYAMYRYSRYKKPDPGQIFYAQAFENPDFCGVRLKTGETYMLNLADPSKISLASHWTKGWYVLDACQSHYGWKALSGKQHRYLSARVRRS